MLIKRFIGKKLNGYIDVDVRLNSDLTFLYGINGSGKTTVVKLINALITRSFSALDETVFQKIQLDLEDNSKSISIVCTSSVNSIELGISSVAETLSIARYKERNVTGLLINDPVSDWYANIATSSALHPVIQELERLPPPMFLSLERRGAASFKNFPGSIFDTDRPWGRIDRNLPNKSALEEASSFASAAFQAAYSAESRLKSELQHDLILLSFDFDSNSISSSFALNAPNKQEALKSIKSPERIIETLQMVGMSPDKISTSVTDFFEHLKSIIQNLPENRAISKVPQKEMSNFVSKMMTYQLNKSQFDRAGRIATRVEQFNSDVNDIYLPIKNFKNLINGFLSISGKEIILDSEGLRINIPTVGLRKIQHLSSGEQQLVVLLTHLSFNISVEISKILIIDEPEVSLHLAWQEMFVDALLQARPNLQIILATHSPSIIMDRDEKAVELVVKYV